MRFRLLGPLEVGDAAGLVPLGGLKQRTVLAVLLLNANRVVPTGMITALTWGESPPTGVRGQVQLYVSRLRKLLGASAIERRPPGYRLRIDPDELDLHRFDAQAAQARADLADGRSGEAAERLRDALMLWRGAPLGGTSEYLIEREGPMLTERYLTALEDLFEAELRAGRHPRIVSELRRVATDEPFRERFQAQLMLALHGSGRTPEALEIYATARDRLASELGVDPGHPLQQAHLTVLRGHTPARPAAIVPRQLPADTAAFAGRAPELDRLGSLLPPEDAGPGGTVIVALSGGAGVGKTTLAVHWAHRIRHRFPDGQLYANLRGFAADGRVASVAEVVRGFLDALPVPGDRIPTGLDAQISLYRSLLADRRMLVVLDNVRDDAHVRPLLPGAPGGLVITTSRDNLSGLIAAEGAHALALDTLPDQDAVALLERRLGGDRLTAEPEAVAEIVVRCARLPLALAVVAARAVTSPALTLSMIAGTLDPLDGVRTAFTSSYQALSPGAARLFRLLGVHGGASISIAAAAALTGAPEPEVRPLLTELTAAYLITEYTLGRFTTHDLLQAYATELAHADRNAAELRDAVRRMLDFYLHTAYAGALLIAPNRDRITLPALSPGVTTPHHAGVVEALAWFTAEHAALIAAVGQAAATAFDTHAWQLAWSSINFLYRKGHWHDAAAVQRIALTAACRLGDPTAMASAHRGLAYAFSFLQRHGEAETHFLEALSLYTGIGDLAGQVQTHRGLAKMAGDTGRHDEALRHAEHALSLSESDPGAHASAHNAVGWYHAQLGHHEQSLTHSRRALAMLQESGDLWGQANTWDSLGYVHRRRHDEEQAAACYRQALELYRKIGDRYPESRMLLHLGDISETLGDLDAARDAWRESLTILEELHHPDAVKLAAKLGA